MTWEGMKNSRFCQQMGFSWCGDNWAKADEWKRVPNRSAPQTKLPNLTTAARFGRKLRTVAMEGMTVSEEVGRVGYCGKWDRNTHGVRPGAAVPIKSIGVVIFAA